ncbi:ParA family protein [Methanoplanus endosymbiosus]|uniref:AAA family ATPase n=1 Tax=Methanoplanus endosymbiosus TaxID=33865 RepID=A0A9E7TLK3_9EURY|nr:AAA family ATPase [Methanoplanus endosymbiosus]UUX93929.1 AAA family ATPase [Methanoplanus endosymbiosus]
MGGFLQKSGEKVLIIDCDPQANATIGLGINPDEQDINMYDVFMNIFEGFPDVTIKDVIKETKSGIFLAPSSLDLVGVEPYLYNIEDRSSVLKEALNSVINDYDHILIDTPPSMGQFVLNGLIAADRIIITLDSSFFAGYGIESLTTIFSDIEESIGKKRSADMAIITKTGELQEVKAPVDEMIQSFKRLLSGKKEKFDENTLLDEIESDLRINIKEICTVPYDFNIIYSQKENMPISHTHPKSRAAQKYSDISEIVRNW